jgi:hypothetical protein
MAYSSHESDNSDPLVMPEDLALAQALANLKITPPESEKRLCGLSEGQVADLQRESVSIWGHKL